MNARLTENTTKTIIVLLSLIFLMYAVIFLYVWWDLKRWELFADSLLGFLQRGSVTNAQSEGLSPAYNIELDPVGLEMEIEAPSLEALDSVIGKSFLSEIEPLGEVTSYAQRESIKEDKGTQADQYQEKMNSTSPIHFSIWIW